MPEIPELSVFFLTVGEKVALESLAALKEHTKQPYKLTVWYDTCGRGIDNGFYDELKKYTDDIIMLSKNHGTSGAWAYGLLYSGGKYVMVVPADTVVQPGYLDKFHFAFSKLEKIACAGSVRNVDVKWDFMINSKYFMPDGVEMFSREAINDVGGICPQFKGMGMENLEWLNRAMAKGWNVVSCNNIMREIGTMHDGRNMNKDADREIRASVDVYLPILDGKYKDFCWWKSDEKREVSNV